LRQARWIALASCFLGLSGCATTRPAVDLNAISSSFNYSAGRGSQSFEAPVSAVLAALHESLTDLDLRSPKAKQDGGVMRVEAETSDHRKVVATIRNHQGITLVAVRVGWFGDEPLSQSLLDRIGVRLGSRPPEAIPATAPSSPSANPFFARGAVPDSEMLRDFAEAPFRDRVIP
jgi:Protein of unknown function (DUF3568)